MVLQDYALYHYESLSRGDDGERDKLERLLRERDRLYQRHPCLYGEDPFYHKYLANDMLSTGFDLRADYELEYKFCMPGRWKPGICWRGQGKTDV